MNSEIIYTKTASGEEAMRQRTRVMQRNVRMVLILVDGQSTVGDLCRKTGNQKMTESALGELEKGGFIQQRVEPDSIWSESRKVAQEIRTAAIGKASKLTAAVLKKPETLESTGTLEVSGASSLDRAPSRPVPDGAVVPLAYHAGASKEVSPATALETDEPRLSLPEAAAGKAARKPVETILEPSIAPGVFASLQKRSSAQTDEEPIRIERRGERKVTGRLLSLALGVFSVLAILFLLVVFFPYGRYVPELERLLSDSSGQVVAVEGMSVRVYPVPMVRLEGVKVGSGSDALRISEVNLQPDIGTLFSDSRKVPLAILSGLTLAPATLTRLPGFFDPLGKPGSPIEIFQLRFEKVDVMVSGLGIQGMDGEARKSSEGRLSAISLHSADRSLGLEVTPRSDGLDFSFDGLAWRPVQGKPVLFDSVSLKGRFEKNLLSISSMDFRVFDGVIRGTAQSRTDRKPNLSGSISFERINNARLGEALGIGLQMTGDSAGRLSFSATTDSWSEMLGVLEGEGEFVARRGSIRGIDLAEAVRRVSGGPVQGGVTQFEQLSGRIRLKPAACQLYELSMSSGLMQSTGQVSIGRAQQSILGKMEIQMRGTVNQTRVPVALSGSLKTPLVQAGKP